MTQGQIFVGADAHKVTEIKVKTTIKPNAKFEKKFRNTSKFN
jgi:hypothetical protein